MRAWAPGVSGKAQAREGWLTFGPVVLLLGAPAALPPLALQDLQPVVLLELQDGQRDLIPEWGAWRAQEGFAMGPDALNPTCPATSPSSY